MAPRLRRRHDGAGAAGAAAAAAAEGHGGGGAGRRTTGGQARTGHMGSFLMEIYGNRFLFGWWFGTINHH